METLIPGGTKCGQFVAAALLAIFVLPAVALTQAPTPLRPLEPSDTSSPAATLNSLIDSCNELDKLIKSGAFGEGRDGEALPTMERILDCLDLSELPKELQTTAGIESALFLKEVLDRIELPPDEVIPQIANSDPPDEVTPLLRWQIPHTRISIARIEQGPQQNVYRFTPESVRRSAQFYRIVKAMEYRTDGREVSRGLYDDYVAATKKKPSLTADTSSPRGTLTLFLDTCNALHELAEKDRYLDRSTPTFREFGMRAISCLDTSQLPEFSREYFDAEAAVCLKEILDRIPLPTAEEIPGIESVESHGGSEALVRWQIPRTQIVIAKVQEGTRRGEFLFSSETVSRAPEIYRQSLSQPYRQEGRPVSKGFYEWWLSRPGNPVVAAWLDRLPKWFQNRQLGMAIWQWFGVLLAIPICLVFMLAVFRVGQARGEKMRGRNLLRYWFTLIFPVIGLLIPIGFKYFLWEYLSLRGSPLYSLSFCADVFFLLGVMILIIWASSRVAESLVALPNIAPQGLDAALIRILCQLLGMVAAAVVFLEGGRYLGFPITTLIASAGIGGLAIALSAQGVIKGLFGTVTVLLDKPYRVGDQISVNGHDGFVEEIGLRSTKIRAFDQRIISIPNERMSDAEIVNMGMRDHIRRISNIQIPLDTPRARVEQAVVCIRSVVEGHEGMDPEKPPRVHFTEFNPDSFNIQVMYWCSPPDILQFHKVSEKINLQIMQVFEEQGIQFSLPFRHSYWKRDDEQGPLEIKVVATDQSDDR